MDVRGQLVGVSHPPSGSGVGTQIIRHEGKCFYLLGHPAAIDFLGHPGDSTLDSLWGLGPVAEWPQKNESVAGACLRL